MDKTSWTSSINTILSGWMALWFNGPSVGEGGLQFKPVIIICLKKHVKKKIQNLNSIPHC